jgi:hypothetical protein
LGEVGLDGGGIDAEGPRDGGHVSGPQRGAVLLAAGK